MHQAFSTSLTASDGDGNTVGQPPTALGLLVRNVNRNLLTTVNYRRANTLLSLSSVQRERVREAKNRNSSPQENYEEAIARPSESQLLTEEDYGAPADERKPSGNETVRINVAGQIFETPSRILERFPKSLLGDCVKRNRYYNSEKDEYFFDRHRQAFEAIFAYFQNGGEQIRRPPWVPVDVFAEELEFYELGSEVLKKYLDDEGFAPQEEILEMPKTEWKRDLWELFEVPHSSRAAKVVAVVNVVVIAVSIFTFVLETLPEFKQYRIAATMPGLFEALRTNVSADREKLLYKLVSRTITEDDIPLYNEPFFITETLCIGWFISELLLRFISCPDKLTFAKNVVNWVDLISIVPYFITLGTMFADQAYSHTMMNNAAAASSNKTEQHDKSEQMTGLAMLRVIRLVRVTRIFKLSRHSKGLQILGQTLKASMKELGMLIFFVFVGVILFSSAIYFSEADLPESHFRSIPDAFWYSVVTMTTVGYGDMRPVSFLVKLVGSCCAIAGVLTIALPVPVIVSNFNYFYHREKESREKSKLIKQNKKSKSSGDLCDSRQLLSHDDCTDNSSPLARNRRQSKLVP